MTHVQEQKALRDETIAAFHVAVAPAEDDDDLLVPREKTKDELEQEEEEYQEFLKREVGQDLKGLITVEEDINDLVTEEPGVDDRAEKEQKMKKVRKRKSKSMDSKAEENQEFLLKFVIALNFPLDEHLFFSIATS